MSDRLQKQRERRNDPSWLTMLVDTMNTVSAQESGNRGCDRAVVEALKAKLQRPAAVRHPSDLTPSF